MIDGNMITEPKPCLLARQAIEDIAEHMSKESGYSPSASLKQIAAPFGGEVQFHDYLAADANLLLGRDGSIDIRGRGDFEIFVPLHTSDTQDRYTVAHELGHYVLHYLWPSRTQTVGRVVAHRSGGNRRAEDEANWYASAFLMPAQAVAGLWQSSPSVGAVAAFFGVSPADARHRINRLKDMGVIQSEAVSAVAA